MDLPYHQQLRAGARWSTPARTDRHSRSREVSPLPRPPAKPQGKWHLGAGEGRVPGWGRWNDTSQSEELRRLPGPRSCCKSDISRMPRAEKPTGSMQSVRITRVRLSTGCLLIESLLSFWIMGITPPRPYLDYSLLGHLKGRNLPTRPLGGGGKGRSQFFSHLSINTTATSDSSCPSAPTVS